MSALAHLQQWARRAMKNSCILADISLLMCYRIISDRFIGVCYWRCAHKAV